ncbi:MAG: inorganic phosphate transporter [Phycisphaeraceae bacterium]|nr:inorganic phosphate transporter [Phycisphaeraceae bacterium]
MAWNIGANDLANAMGTSVGSGSLTLRRAVILAAVLEFCGAYFVGSSVTDTMRKGIVDPMLFEHEPMLLVCGMLASLLAAGAWLQVASYFGWPVSTTHTIVGAILGFGAVHGGLGVIRWTGHNGVSEIVASWVISPLLAAAVAFFVFQLIRRQVMYSPHPLRATRRLAPWLVMIVFATLTLSVLLDAQKNKRLDIALHQLVGASLLVGLASAVVSYALMSGKRRTEHPSPGDSHEYYAAMSLQKAAKQLRRVQGLMTGEAQMQLVSALAQVEGLTRKLGRPEEAMRKSTEHQQSERIFACLQIISAGYVAFAHGANDVANAVGPMAAVVQTIRSGIIANTTPVPTWILLMGAVGIVIGLSTWGWRVIETVGKRITELTPTRGFSAEFATALTVLLASKIGLPVSTTHTLVGAVMGVGLARGMSALNLNAIRDIVVSWIITIPAGAGLSIFFFFILKAIFLR